MKFLITMHRDEDGMVIADCPAIPGCVSQGRTEEEAEQSIREAIQAYDYAVYSSRKYRKTREFR